MKFDDFGFVTALGLSSTVLSSVVIFDSGQAGSAVFERSMSVFELCLTDFYGSTHYDTNALDGNMLKA